MIGILEALIRRSRGHVVAKGRHSESGEGEKEGEWEAERLPVKRLV